jgi:CLN3 protein.
MKAFIILNLCYQIGVTISRSSLECFIIDKVAIVTYLQVINFIWWAVIAWNQTLDLVYQFLIMIWVGLMGGASFVNIYYKVLNDPKIAKKDKEISINIVSMCNNIGVIMATLTSLVLEKTIYSDK